jgi:hypothetical protein
MEIAAPDHARVAALRDDAFRALRDAMPSANFDEASRCSARLRSALPHRSDLHRNRVFVAYGGGKDSSYTLAFVRAMQLILLRLHDCTFQLRVATNRHAGMPRAVMENIHREYEALRLYGDPDCELLLVDGDEISTFDVDSPQRERVVRRNRLDILMTGHRTFADGRPTFCNACNISVFNSFGLAAAHGDGADLIITGDSKDEQRKYTAWVGRMARQIAPAPKDGGGAQPVGQNGGIGRLLRHLDRISQAYTADIHGGGTAEPTGFGRVHADVPDRLEFFSIYSETAYRAGDHMDLLTGFLGFRFDDVAFSFTESDCGNPALMAHLRALKAEHVYQRSYAEGLAEYVEFAAGLMRQKDIPTELIAQVRARYEGPGAARRMRTAMAEYAMTTFGLTEEHLVCMTYSPFAEKGAGLEEFLRREHPALAETVPEIRALLADESGAAGDTGAELERISGLTLPQLRILYRSPVKRFGGPGGTRVIDAVLAGDPHKAVITTRHSPDGPEILEQISGR